MDAQTFLDLGLVVLFVMVGFLHVRDLLGIEHDDPPRVADLARPIVVLPGIVTLEDLAEVTEVVGHRVTASPSTGTLDGGHS